MAIRVAIVEDERQASDLLKEYILRFEKENAVAFSVTQYADAVGLLEQYTPVFDIIFMDIQMPYMNGMDAARRLRILDQKVLLIFTTSLAQYAVEGYDVDALSYLVKPYGYFEFSMKLSKAMQRVPKVASDIIVLNTKAGSVRLSASEILYVGIRGHKTDYHTASGIYSHYSTLKIVEEKLPRETFARCNSCYLVNLFYVRRIEENTCVLSDGTALSVSHPKKQQFLSAWNAYCLQHTANQAVPGF